MVDTDSAAQQPSHVTDPPVPLGTRPRELLGARRFLPFFSTQFLGAFNDNVFKNALIIMISFGIADAALTHKLVNLAAGLFILPFFLFSALAGQLADRADKASYMRRIKQAEIAIMLLGAVGFLLDSVPLLLAVLFLTGAQSTFFGPAKYAILPQHLGARELTTGNALVGAGTFLAILLGTIGGGLLVVVEPNGPLLVALSVVAVAVAGYLASRHIPDAPSTQPGTRIHWNLPAETLSLLRQLKSNRTILLCVLGISWFWFLGTVYLTQFPNYTRLVLGGDAGVAVLLLAMFSIGIGIGSFICEKLSRGRIEAGLAPIGAIGMTVFGIHLGLTEPVLTGEVLSVGEFLSSTRNLPVMIYLLLISIFGGLYIVPLYTLVQHLSDPARRARVIAANNILNALFMVAASVLAIVVLGAGYGINELFLIIAILNAGVAAFIFSRAPEFVFRMLGWLLVHGAYRVSKQGLHHIPAEGPAIIVSNHVSFADAVLIHAICPRRLRFVMDASIYRLPVLNWLFRAAGAIPIADPRVDRALVRQGYELIAEALTHGDVVCLFPEGGISRDGHIGKFKNGIEKIVRRSPVPVVPMAIRGMWGSFFSYSRGPAMRKWPKRMLARITVVAGPAIDPQEVDTRLLHQRVTELRGDHP